MIEFAPRLIAISRVSEVNTTFSIEREVVRAVMTLALELPGKHRLRTTRIVPGNAVAVLLTGVEHSIGREYDAIRAICVGIDRLHRIRRGVITANLVVLNRCVKEAFTIPCRTLSDRIRPRKQLKFPRHRAPPDRIANYRLSQRCKGMPRQHSRERGKKHIDTYCTVYNDNGPRCGTNRRSELSDDAFHPSEHRRC